MTWIASRGRQTKCFYYFLFLCFLQFFPPCVLVFSIHNVYVHSPGGQDEVSVSAHDDSIKVLEGEERRRDQGEETQVKLIHTPPTRISTFSAAAGVKLDFPPSDWNSKAFAQRNEEVVWDWFYLWTVGFPTWWDNDTLVLSAQLEVKKKHNC